MNIFNWDKYNSNLKLIKKLINYNKKNKFNYLEAGLYNHIRDLFCITLILISYKNNKDKRLNILDYGSNMLTYANIANKINLNNYNFSIYDPFNKKKLKKNNNFRIFNDEKYLNNKWDIVNFGSSIQYIDNINLLNKVSFKTTKAILITHTPFSLFKSYVSKQTNNKNLNQKIHSYNDILTFFKKKKFILKFKSRNKDKYISSKKKYKTFSMNLLFIKK
tara:strand:+ start:773 stop:1429 length:657 start_codon:yes stop_codon:yes gene_type:complete